MRKKILILSGILLFSVASCHNNLDTNNIISINYLNNLFKKVSKGNYTLSYLIGDESFDDVFTNDYYYIGYLNSGSMLLKTYLDDSIAYNFKIDKVNNNVEIEGQTYNEEYTYQELTSLSFKNKLSLLNNYTFNDYEIKNNKVYVNDSNLIDIFSAQLDFTGIKRIIFYLEKNVDLMMEFQGFDFTTNEFYTLNNGGKVSLINTAKSKIDLVDSYLKNINISNDSLIDKAENIFGNVSFTSAIYDNIYEDEYISIVRDGFTNLDLYNDYIRITDISEENIQNIYTYKKIKNTNGLEKVGVNGKNEVVNQKIEMTYDDFQFVNKDNFELDKFKKLNEKDEYYTYLGKNATKLAFSITQHNRFKEWPVVSIKAKVINNKISQIIFSTGLMLDKLTNKYFYHYVDTRVNDEVNVIDDITKKTPSKDDDKIKNYLSYLNQDDSVFKVINKDSAWDGSRETLITKTKNLYTIGTYIKNDEEYSQLEKLGEGYYYKNNKVYTFTYDEKNNVTVDSKVINKTLKDIVNFNISSEILILNNDQLTTFGDIINIGDSLGFASNPLTIDPSTLVMNINNDKIENINFEYYNGKEEINIYYDNIVENSELINKLDEEILKIEAQKFTNFYDYSKEGAIYASLVEYANEDFAKKVPCLISEEVSNVDNMLDGYICDYAHDDGINDCVFVYFTNHNDEDYIKKYKEYLINLGYKQNNNIYTLDDVKFEFVDANPYESEFLRIYKV